MNPISLKPNTMMCSDPYVFSYHVLTDSTLVLKDQGTWSVYCYSGNVAVLDRGNYRAVFTDDVVHGSGDVEFIGNGTVFVVGDLAGHQAVDWIDVQKGANTYTVTKPWGKEIWLTGPERRDYCMKRIHINAGHQTSLQYHREKFETNVVIEGNIELIGESYNELVAAPAFVNIAPPTVHRVRALSDIVLIEASTAHLDDVVRLQDDSNRPSGRIEDEHQK
jgi:mannose-6-phosphate isomerase